MNVFERADELDDAVLSRWCPQEALGWLAIGVGTLLAFGSATVVTGLLVLRNVIR